LSKLLTSGSMFAFIIASFGSNLAEPTRYARKK
jgi:hypothetical protein